MKRIFTLIFALCFAFTLQAQNFGEFMVNSHISDDNMKVLYHNCDSLGIVPVFHYFYSDDTLQNEFSKIRRPHISQGFLPCGMINGKPIATTPYTQSDLYNIDAWIPLLNTEFSVDFDVESSLEVLNSDESVLHFELVNLQGLTNGDIIQMALVQDIGEKQNVQVKMNTKYGIIYEGQKVLDVSLVWPTTVILDDCTVVVWVEQEDKSVLFSEEFSVENEYVNQLPTLEFELVTNGGDNPTTLNWFFVDFTGSLDYEDDINGDVLLGSVKWEENGIWTLPEPITSTFSYRYRNAGTYNPEFKVIDSQGGEALGTTEVTISWITGVDNIENVDIFVYPNPINEKFTIYGDFIEQPFKITNGIGQTIYNGILNSTQTEVNINLERGLYFLEINNKFNKIIKK